MLSDNLDGLELDDREHVCEKCHLVHWTPTGPSFCDR